MFDSDSEESLTRQAKKYMPEMRLKDEEDFEHLNIEISKNLASTPRGGDQLDDISAKLDKLILNINSKLKS